MDTKSTAAGARSTAEQVSEGVELSGRHAIVTGANTGLGLETTRVVYAAYVAAREGWSFTDYRALACTTETVVVDVLLAFVPSLATKVSVRDAVLGSAAVFS